MGQEVGFRVPKSKYGACHLPMCVLTWIRKVGFTKSEFFDLYPDYNYANEGFPEVLIQIFRKKEQLKEINQPLGNWKGKSLW